MKKKVCGYMKYCKFFYIFYFQYQCFVENCTQKWQTKKERRSHCIEFHNFPADFRYEAFETSPKKLESKKSESMQKKKVEFRKQVGPKKHLDCSTLGHRNEQSISEQKSDGNEFVMADLEEALPPE